MIDWIVAMLNALGGGVDDGTVNLLGNTPAEYNETVYQFALNVNDVAVKPVAAVILSIIFTLELAKVSTRIDGDRQLGVKIVAAAMFKIALLLVAAQNAKLFLDAINEITTTIFAGITDAMPAGTSAATNLGDGIRDQIDSRDYMGQAGAMLILVFPFLAAKCAQLAFHVIVLLRFFELYLLTAFNSLPIAFLGTDETKPMAIGYFKKYASTCVKAVTLFIGVWIYRSFMSTFSIASYDGSSIAGWCIGNLGDFLMASVLLLGMIGLSNGAAKALVGE